MLADQLQYYRRHLPEFLGEDLYWISFARVRETLKDMRVCWPQYVSPIRPLIKTHGGQWAFSVSIGHGEEVTLIECTPHVGEFIWAQTVTDYGMFLCENPHLLAGRTVILYFGDPEGVSQQLARWGEDISVVRAYAYRGLLLESVLGHWRHPLPMLNDCWSYPVIGAPVHITPTAGAQGGMMLVDGIKEAGLNLAHIVLGHNRHAGAGGYVNQSGPNASLAAAEAEAEVARAGIQLDPGPADSRMQVRHPGTTASWTSDTARDRWQHSGYQGGGTLYDYASQPHLFPDVAVHATELPIIGPRNVFGEHEYPPVRPGFAAFIQARTARIKELTDDLVGIAAAIEPHVPPDRYISALTALPQAATAWGVIPLDSPERHPEMEVPYNRWFQLNVVQPLFVTRRVGPASHMLRRYSGVIRRTTGLRAVTLRRELTSAARMAMYMNWVFSMPVSPEALKRAQILAFEAARVAAHGEVVDA